MKKLYFVFILLVFTASAQVSFVNQASALGVNMSAGDLEYGSGISFCDYNNDGWDDITIATQGGSQTEFYLNDQDGTFTRQNITLVNNNVQGRQLVWVDYDNDGDKDLFIVSNTDGNHLYNNNGSLIFTDVTAAAGLPTNNIESWGASFGDVNNDGYLDLFISNRDDNLVQPNLLFLNNQDGTFTDISLSSGIHTTSHLSFCSAFFDYNNDGWQDIYIANDKIFNENFLYHNNGDNTFTNVAPSAGVNIAIDAMTTTVGDYNNDGWFDIYVTNTPTQGNALFRNNGDNTFTNVTVSSGTAFNSFAWGAVFLDADNDMDLDMYVSSSMDGSVPQLASAVFYTNNNDGTFSTPNAGFVGDNGISHANAVGDVDNDGYPEIIVSNANNENVFLWKNQTIQNNNWLKVKLEGVISNKDGIGSKIEISINGEKQYRYTLCGEGYISQNSNSEFFGLGTNTIVDYVKVTWLSGAVDYFENVNANQQLNILEGSNPLHVDDFNNLSLFVKNPVGTELHISSSETITEIMLYDMLGNRILHEKLNTHSYQKNVSSLSQGIYLLKINSLNTQHIKRIFKK
ncbi:FG-GAP-like repeat-containing protein [Hanstruepera ponticola]|uniref:FG-GAP-like repeat-containing protein n=1 Tax=Hanstruepera ponticola TaxID=2042995 RepID=UPI0013C467A8|nr:FG-GAP-like repeat-containing protein [Hanstruepera ponticola]